MNAIDQWSITIKRTVVSHLVYLVLLDTSVLEDLFDGLHGLAEQAHVELFELHAGEGIREVVAALEALDLKTCGLLAGKSALRLLHLALELAHSPKVLRGVDTSLLLVELDEVINNPVVEVLTTEMCITSCFQNFENAVVDGKEGDVEGSSSEIVDDNTGFTALLVETVRDSGGSGFVGDTEDLEASNRACVLGRLCGLLHLRQYHGADFFWGLKVNVLAINTSGIAR